MVIVRNIIIAAVIAVAGVVAFNWFFQSDEAKIKKRFKTIAELSSKDVDEHELTSAVNAGRISEMFADICRIEIPAHNISRTYAKKDITAQVMGARARYSEILLTFHDLDIRFPEEGIARVAFTAVAEAVGIPDEFVRETHEIVSFLVKIENNWYFTQVEAMDVLER